MPQHPEVVSLPLADQCRPSINFISYMFYLGQSINFNIKYEKSVTFRIEDRKSTLFIYQGSYLLACVRQRPKSHFS